MKLKEILEYYEKYIDMLLEAVNYNQMFSPTLIQHLGVDANEIKSYIAKVKSTLKREDRIVWFLRLYKMNLIAKALDTNKTPEFRTYADKELQKYNSKAGSNVSYGELKRLPSSSRLLPKLEHYYSMNVHKINEYVFKYQTPKDVVAQFEKWEDEHLAKNSKERHIVERNEQVFLDCGGGWYWLDLGRASCREEADAMGHCGNGGVTDPNITIISLRKKVQQGKKVFWQPHATAIYYKREKSIEQIKGANNNKPDSSLAPQMFKLFMDDRVQGFIHGSYEAKQDFRPDDLPQDMQDTLEQEKPEMLATIAGNVFEDIRTNGLDTSNLNRLREEEELPFTDDGDIIIEWFAALSVLFERYGDEIVSEAGDNIDHLYGSQLVEDAIEADNVEEILTDGLDSFDIEELEEISPREDYESSEDWLLSIDKELADDMMSAARQAVSDSIIESIMEAVDYLGKEGKMDSSFEHEIYYEEEYDGAVISVEKDVIHEVLSNNSNIDDGESLIYNIRDDVAMAGMELTAEEPDDGWYDYSAALESFVVNNASYHIKDFLKKRNSGGDE